jgi:hypothetical protein
MAIRTSKPQDSENAANDTVAFIMSLSIIHNFNVFDYIKRNTKRLLQEVCVDVQISIEYSTSQSLGQ